MDQRVLRKLREAHASLRIKVKITVIKSKNEDKTNTKKILLFTSCCQ